MPDLAPHWDYLIVTASNERQAEGYQSQLDLRRRLGLLGDIREVLVVPDLEGKRIGSGGSTVLCLMKVLERETKGGQCLPYEWERILSGLRILIIHAGGDSRRLPAYGPCGKIFVPVPGNSDSPVGFTLFDRLLPTFLEFGPGVPGRGQTVVASGDVLSLFDPSTIALDRPGVTALGCMATAQAASKHGVFCKEGEDTVRLFLQKPSPADQQRQGALDSEGRAILDLGIMSFDAQAAVGMLRASQVEQGASGLEFSASMRQILLSQGLDLYREICCALGTQATADHHIAESRRSGSAWSEEMLRKVHAILNGMAFHVQILRECRFLHFGTTAQLISSGKQLLEEDGEKISDRTILSINNRMEEGGALVGGDGWVEACRVSGPVKMAGKNVVIGVDVDRPVDFPVNACIDVLPGKTPEGMDAWFIRCYGIDDAFKDSMFNGIPIQQWLQSVGAGAEDVWDAKLAEKQRTLWDARVFPAEKTHAAWRQWLWMFQPQQASQDQKVAWRNARRFSVAEISLLSDQNAFHDRRQKMRTRGEAGS